jgi:protein-S-isoprenylcysteine O-methyltransferase Ste14
VPLGFVVAALVLWLAQPTPRSFLIGFMVAGVGEALRIWAAGHLNKGQEVTASGPYRWFAHPLYVGSLLIGAGLTIACNRLIVAVLAAAYLGATLTAAIKTEEADLRRAFGDRYERYRRHRAVDSVRRFSVERAVANREHRAIFGFVAVLLLLLWKATYN